MVTLMQNEDRCPHVRCRCGECPNECDLSGHTCVLELGEPCRIWEDIQEQWRQEIDVFGT